jgi:ABC-type lipoprotein release transport system permease subunit
MGACVRLESRTGPCYTVVGIAGNAPRFRILEDPPLQAYVPLDQTPDSSPPRTLLIRGRDDPSAASELAMRELSAQLGAGATASSFLYRDWLEPQLTPWRLGARLLSGVATLSLILAVIGLYSVLAYSVTQRAHELGVRIALGAGVTRIIRVVLAQGMRALVLGILLGLAMAAAAGKLIAALLYNTSTVEPVVYVVVASTLLTAGVLASIVPAVRAARIDPLRSLRSD